MTLAVTLPLGVDDIGETNFQPHQPPHPKIPKELRGERYLRQLLSRLRRVGLLRKVGQLRFDGHNLPEVVMSEAPIEPYTDATIERIVAKYRVKADRVPGPVYLIRQKMRFNPQSASLNTSIVTVCSAASAEAGAAPGEGSPRNGVPFTVKVLQTGLALLCEKHVYDLRDGVRHADRCVRTAQIRADPARSH